MVASWKVWYHAALLCFFKNPWATWKRTELTSFCLFFIPVMRNGVSSTFTYGRIYLWSDLKLGYYLDFQHSHHSHLLRCKQRFYSPSIVSVALQHQFNCTFFFFNTDYKDSKAWQLWLSSIKHDVWVECWCWCVWPLVILSLLPASVAIWMYVCDLRTRDWKRLNQLLPEATYRTEKSPNSAKKKKKKAEISVLQFHFNSPF